MLSWDMTWLNELYLETKCSEDDNKIKNEIKDEANIIMCDLMITLQKANIMRSKECVGDLQK